MMATIRQVERTLHNRVWILRLRFTHSNLETGDDYKLDELKDEAWRVGAIERKRA
jgi:hypothetical protein